MANIILTQNAKRRIHEDNLSEGIVYSVINDPNKKFLGRDPATTVFQKKFDWGFVTVVGKLGQGDEWIIISCFSRKVTNSYAQPTHAKQQGSFLERILQVILKVLNP